MGKDKPDNLEQLNCQYELIKDYDVIKEVAKNESNKIEILLLYIRTGLYPPPDLLIDLESRFEKYFNSNNSLEEAMFGSIITGAGDYSSRKKTNYPHEEFKKLQALEKAGIVKNLGTQKTKAELIKKFTNSEISADSIVRTYRKTKNG
jgi:hypothetical protein